MQINVDKRSYSHARHYQRVHRSLPPFDLFGYEGHLSPESELMLTLQCAAEITVSFRLVSL